MGESRTELIAWLNDLLGLNYTKVEQCGTGAAYTQIIDSIYGEFRTETVRRGGGGASRRSHTQLGGS